jgi:hypothetical protein
LVPVLAAAALVVACSGNKAFLNEKDPFDDPFFSDGLGSGTSALDEVMREPAPSVGWLARDGNVQAVPPSNAQRGGGFAGAPEDENVLLEAENESGAVAARTGSGEDESEEGAMVPAGEKSTYDQASEATMATMSVLFGLGMAALPFLIGT